METNQTLEDDVAPLAMADLLLEIIRCLVDAPEAVKIDEQGGGSSTSVLIISVADEDVGKVLGREGATIKLVRDLFTRVAAAEGRRAIIEVDDPKKRVAGGDGKDWSKKRSSKVNR